MRATTFEFRKRFWLIGLIFSMSFFLFTLDPMDSGVWLAQGLFGPTADRGEVRLVFLGATLLVLGAALVRTWATAYLHSGVVHDRELHTEGLVADGPYRYTRNPLYFATILMSVGIGLFASRLGFVFLNVALYLFLRRLIGREEEELARERGEDYRAYLSAVPRFWPSLWPRVPASGAVPRFGQAIVGEVFFWGFAAATLAFALTFDLRAYFAIATLGFVLYFTLVPRLKGSRPSGSDTDRPKDGQGDSPGPS
jgi:protein-S-isoprenylcysteine O-methyltransferase Ste14